MRKFGLAASFLAVAVGTSGFAIATRADAAPAPDESLRSEALPLGQDDLNGGDYLVRFVADADAETETARLRADGIDVTATYMNMFPGAAVSATPAQVTDLRADARIESLTHDTEMSVPMSAQGDDFRAEAVQAGATWGLDRVDQRTLPLSGTFEYPLTGAGVKIYVLDSGIRLNHNEFTGRIGAGAYSYGVDPSDCNGHGSHVSGTAAGTTYGVAKGATIVPVKVLACDGTASGSVVLAGLEWIITNHQAGTPAVLNASIGGAPNPLVDDAFQAAIDDGITVVLAAGNDGVPACGVSPARLPAAVTVAATNISDFSPNWSNYGSCIDVFAPGVGIKSAWFNSSSATNTIDGTSMASPHVAGAAALLLERTPTLTPAQVRSLLVNDATLDVVTNKGTGSPNRLLFVPATAPPSFVSVVPARVLETRPGLFTADGQFAGQGQVASGGVVNLTVGGRGGLFEDASTAVLNVTVVDPAAAGFITVFPCGFPFPTSSSVNFAAHATVANAVVSKVGVNGQVCLYSNVATHLVVDVTGFFPAWSSFTSLEPARLMETRPGMLTIDGKNAGMGVVPSGGVVELPVGGRVDVASDAMAAVLNVTVVEPSAAGYVTVFPCGSGIPNSSSVNFVAGATVANAVVSKLGTNGRVCLFTNVATHLVVDVNGYFPVGSTFTSVVPARLLETRPGFATVDGQSAGQGQVVGGAVVELLVGNRGGLVADPSAVVLNVTVVEPSAAGFVTVFPCGSNIPTSSSVNFVAGATVANAVVSKVGAGAKVCLYTNVATHLLADVTGFFPAV